MLPIPKEYSKLNSNKTHRDYNATSLYPSAMWDQNGVYPKIGTAVSLKPHVNDVYVEVINNITFNQDGNESAILEIKYYNPSNLIFQHLPVYKS